VHIHCYVLHLKLPLQSNVTGVVCKVKVVLWTMKMVFHSVTPRDRVWLA
jgi:hypothetical protein